MTDLDTLGRRHAAVVHESLADAEPPAISLPQEARRIRQGWLPIVAAVGFAAAVGVVLSFGVVMDSPDVPPGGDPAETQYFSPPRVAENGEVRFPLTLLDGTEVSLTLPPGLADEVVGFVPGGALGWDDGPCCSRSLDVRIGTVSDIYGDREPDAAYLDASRRTVGFYTSPDLDHIVFELGPWVVRAWDGGPGAGERFTEDDRRRFASLVDGYTTGDGFLVLQPAPPMTVRKTDSPDATLVDAEGSSIAGVITDRPCAARVNPTGRIGHSYSVSRDAGLTVICGERDGITVWVSRVDLTADELAAISVERPTTTLPFDFEGFLREQRWALLDDPVRTGLLLLAPEEARATVERLLTDEVLTELDGVQTLEPSTVAVAADTYTYWEGTDSLAGSWVGYGLIPRYADTPVADWARILAGIDGIHIVQVEFAIGSVPGIPDEWEPVANLPFRVARGAIVESITTGVVIVQLESTYLIRRDGSWTQGDSPVPVPTACCGSATLMPAGDTAVLLDGSDGRAWILDPVSTEWRPAGTRPRLVASGVLGSVRIGDELIVVATDGRFGGTSTAVSALHLGLGAWREIEAVPVPLSVGGVTTDGERLLVTGVRQDGNNRVIGERTPFLFEYTESTGWRRLADVPIDGQAATVAWVEGAGLLAWNYELQSALLDATDTWAPLADAPMPACECYPRLVVTGGGAAAVSVYVSWFEAASRTWHAIRLPAGARFAVAESEILSFVDDGEGSLMLSLPLPPPRR